MPKLKPKCPIKTKNIILESVESVRCQQVTQVTTRFRRNVREADMTCEQPNHTCLLRLPVRLRKMRAVQYCGKHDIGLRCVWSATCSVGDDQRGL